MIAHRRVVAVAALGLVVAVNPAANAASTSHHTVHAPPVNGAFDYQLGGSYRPGAGIRIVDRDRTSTPAPGVYSICYVNAFQTQAYQDHWWQVHHPNLLLHKANGSLVEDPGWPGEYLLDTATTADRHALSHVIGSWINGCASKGFKAIEPDNLDSNTRSHGLLSTTDNLDFAKLLSARAHRDGLAIAQKNDAEVSQRARKIAHFDFAIAEECQVYDECSDYLHAYGRHVIEIEYTDNGRSAYRKACAARGAKISITLRDRDVVARGHKGYVDKNC